ncbi:MAG: flippase [Candidatus Helarchaeota archaeon]
MDSLGENIDDINKALHKVAKSSSFILIGYLLENILAFIGSILFARTFGPDKYGIFSFSRSFLEVMVIIGLMGLDRGIMRQISYYNSKNQKKKVRVMIIYSLIFSFLGGMLILLIIFLLFDLFLGINDSQFIISLKLISFGIPFYILIFVLNGIFRGYKRVKENIIFSGFLKNILYIIMFLIFIIILNNSFISGILIFSLSIIITSLFFFIYFFKKFKFTIKEFSIKNLKNNLYLAKKLLHIAIPIALYLLLLRLSIEVNNFILIIFKSSFEVGLYNSAISLSIFSTMILNAVIFIYIPILSELYGKKKIYEIRIIYKILTKWLCFFSFPLLIIVFYYSKILLGTFFGEKYISANLILKIISIGYFMHIIMGPNGATLIALGKTRFLMWNALETTIINLCLNLFLIPFYSVNGAAFSFLFSVFFMNIMRSVKLYSSYKIHAFKQEIIKPILLSTILMTLLFFLIDYMIHLLNIQINIWIIPIIYIFFIILYGFSLLITKSLSNEDIEILTIIEKKFGINLTKLKKILKKFKIV